MKRLASTRFENAFSFQDTAEVIMGVRIVANLDNPALKGKLAIFLEHLVQNGTMPELERFEGYEADVLLGGLSKIIASKDQDGWQADQASQMLEQYADPLQRTRDLRPEREDHGAFTSLEADLKQFEETGRIT